MKALLKVVLFLLSTAGFQAFSMQAEVKEITSIESAIGDNIVISVLPNPKIKSMSGMGSQYGDSQILTFIRGGSKSLNKPIPLPKATSNKWIVISCVGYNKVTLISENSLRPIMKTLGERNKLVIDQEGKATVVKEQ